MCGRNDGRPLRSRGHSCLQRTLGRSREEGSWPLCPWVAGLQPPPRPPPPATDVEWIRWDWGMLRVQRSELTQSLQSVSRQTERQAGRQTHRHEYIQTDTRLLFYRYLVAPMVVDYNILLTQLKAAMIRETYRPNAWTSPLKSVQYRALQFYQKYSNFQRNKVFNQTLSIGLWHVTKCLLQIKQ